MCFLQQSLNQFDDVFVDHMAITEEDSSVVVLWTDRSVVYYRLLKISLLHLRPKILGLF